MEKTTLVEVLFRVVSFSPVYNSHVQYSGGNGPQQVHCNRDLQDHEAWNNGHEYTDGSADTDNGQSCLMYEQRKKKSQQQKQKKWEEK